MEDYRSYHATPGQIDSLWSVIGTLRQQVEDLTERLRLVEEEGQLEPSVVEAVTPKST